MHRKIKTFLGVVVFSLHALDNLFSCISRGFSTHRKNTRRASIHSFRDALDAFKYVVIVSVVVVFLPRFGGASRDCPIVVVVIIVDPPATPPCPLWRPPK